jgi:hypothetical protein
MPLIDEGVICGAAQFDRYLEDLVGKEVVNRIWQHDADLSRERSGHVERYIDGYGLTEDKKIISAFKVPFNEKKPIFGDCAYFLSKYTEDGQPLSASEFTAPGFPKLNFLRRIFNRDTFNKLKNYNVLSEEFRKSLVKEILKIPFVVLPLKREVIVACFDKEIGVSKTGAFSDDIFKRDGIEDWKLNYYANHLRSGAYFERADAVIIGSPFDSQSRGQYWLVKFESPVLAVA